MPIEYNIKIEYHPSSGKEPEFLSIDDYKTSTESSNSSDHIDQEPWKPFCTCLDFEIAELILDSYMNKQQKSTLLKLIYKCIKELDSFTISNTRDLGSTWEQARTYQAAGVCNFGIIIYELRCSFFFSFKSGQLKLTIREKVYLTTCGLAQSGTGVVSFLMIVVLYPSFIGMPNIIMNQMETELRDSLMNLGQQTHGGKFK